MPRSSNRTSFKRPPFKLAKRALKLEAMAKSKSENQFSINPFAKSTSNSDVEQIQNFRSVTENHKNIENLIKNSVEANFTSNTVQSCIAKVSNSQSVEAIDIRSGGTIAVVIDQKQGSTLLTKCVNDTSVGNSIVNDVTSYLDIVTKDDTDVTLETEFDGGAESESKNKGIFESIGSMIESIGTAIGNIFGGLFSMLGSFGMPCIASCVLSCICCIVILFMGIGFKALGSMGSSGSIGSSDAGG